MISNNRYGRIIKKDGFDSGFEAATAKYLRMLGVGFKHHPCKIPYTRPQESKKYTPDFMLENGILIETKGEFLPKDRKKHLLIQAQHPDLDIRFVFTNPYQKLTDTGKQTYADWCNKHGFKWAHGTIPNTWMKEDDTKRASPEPSATRKANNSRKSAS